ncbi:MAG: hypothetical protein OXB92_04760, partial [Acidimicrobiaceae bacterium]|nr:hypothetical protein [Acidimicrobiaceae bacterium]
MLILDTQGFGLGRHHHDGTVAHCDLDSLERTSPTHLPEPGLDSVEATHDGERRLGGTHRRRPILRRLHRPQHRLVTVDQIGENMIVVRRVTVTRMQRRGRPSHQNSIRN